MLKIYECSYFDHVQWRYQLYELLCESEEQARSFIDKECPLWYRLKVYRNRNEADQDSLTIKEIVSNIDLPYVTWSSKRS